MAAAGGVAGLSRELPTVDIAATITPALVGLSLLCLAIATFGALGTSSLAVYSPTRLQNRRGGAAGQALIEELERRENEYRVVARFCVLGGLVGAMLAMQAGVDNATAPWAMGGLVVLALLLCGSLPSAIADVRAESTLLRVLPVLRGGLLVLRWPLVLPVLAVTGGVLRVLRIREAPSTDPDEIAEQVLAAVADSVDDDALADEERAWIGNIVGLKDQQVSAIMTPRPDLVALQADTPVRDAVRTALEHGFSRYPIYRERIDEIVGIFHVKDALALIEGGRVEGGRVEGGRVEGGRVEGGRVEGGRVQGGGAADAPIHTLMRQPLFVPESMAVPQLLRRLQADKVHFAIVLDEYGTTAGIVSVEDVLEEIVGDIDDEYDAEDGPDPDQVTVVEEGHVVEVPGRLAVDEVNRLLALNLPDDGDWETVAGFVIHNLNRIPAPGEAVQIEGVEFHVLRADERRVDRLRVTAPAPEPANRDG